MKKTLKTLVIAALGVSLTGCGFINLFVRENDTKNEEVELPEEALVPKEVSFYRGSYTYSDLGQNNIYGITYTPNKGTPKFLVVPIWFSDSNDFILKTRREEVRTDIENAFFGKEGANKWHSVSSYYKEESGGDLSLTGTVSEWLEINTSYKNYGVDSSGDEESRTANLVEYATNWYFSNHDDNRQNYDFDHNGYIDGVVLIYAAPNYGSLNNKSISNLWAYTYWVGNKNNLSIENPGADVYFWASYDFMYDYRTPKVGKYGYGDCSHITLDTHTYIHEVGHMFGLEDYYDYSDNSYNPAGGFSMQDCNVGGHDPYSTYALGWGNAYVPSQSETIYLDDYQSSHNMIILSKSLNGATSISPFDEYIILELYSPNKLNYLDSLFAYRNKIKGSLKTGIRVWHVDARLAYFRNFDKEASMERITNNPKTTLGRVVHAFSNSYDGNAIMGAKYNNYNILQLIRNSTYSPLVPKETQVFSDKDLFYEGDYFSMSKYKSQFINNSKLNSGLDLGFDFKVNEIKNNRASITIIKK